VHLWYLIGFENRLLILIRWLFTFITGGRGARLITGQPHQTLTADPVALPAAPPSHHD
jgi:hypothetical protein